MATTTRANGVDVEQMMSERAPTQPPDSQERVWRLVASDGSTTLLGAPTPVKTAVRKTAKAPAVASGKGADASAARRVDAATVLGARPSPMAATRTSDSRVGVRPSPSHQSPASPDLAEIARHWADLPEAIRRSILAMVRSTVAGRARGRVVSHAETLG